MKRLIFLFLSLLSISINAQENNFFYATMDIHDAQTLKKDYPSQIEILKTKQNKAAVYLSESAIHILHNRVITHGPGFVYQSSAEKALAALDKTYEKPKNTYIFSITEEPVVEEALNLVNVQNIANHIVELESYGTRYHTYTQAEQAVLDLKAKWETMINDAGRSDISVRIFEHINTPMPSLILTIEGADAPDELVVTGGHLDSTSQQGNSNAPGADDNASGIATLTEVLRVLLDMEYVPQKTIEIMAFAAEEIGLVGSAEIADNYADNNVNVVSYVQFDMTGYNGSANEVYITTDNYNSASLNNFLIDLMDNYNSSGDHQFSYGFSQCNYGCSDHYSWAQAGYEAAFPFESAFGQHNPNIHSANDTFSFLGNADHTVSFAKLALEYLIETAKTHATASIDNNFRNQVQVYVENGLLHYQINGLEVETIQLFDLNGKLLIDVTQSGSSGTVSIGQLSSGMYLTVFKIDGKGKAVKKVHVP